MKNVYGEVEGYSDDVLSYLGKGDIYIPTQIATERTTRSLYNEAIETGKPLDFSSFDSEVELNISDDPSSKFNTQAKALEEEVEEDLLYEMVANKGEESPSYFVNSLHRLDQEREKFWKEKDEHIAKLNQGYLDIIEQQESGKEKEEVSSGVDIANEYVKQVMQGVQNVYDIKAIKQNIRKDHPATFSNVVKGIAMEMLPVVPIIKRAGTTKEVVEDLGELHPKFKELGLQGDFGTGSIVFAIRKYAEELPSFQEQKTFLQNVSKVLKKNEGVMGASQFISFDIMNQVLEESNNWAEANVWFENAAEVIDFTVVAGILKALGKSVKMGLFPKLFTKDLLTKPSQAFYAVRSVLEGGENADTIVKATGLNKETIFHLLLPMVKNADRQVPPEMTNLLARLATNDEALEILKEMRKQGGKFEESVYGDVVDELIKTSPVVGDIEADGFQLQRTILDIDYNKGEILYNGYVGKALGTEGFKNEGAARMFGSSQNFGKEGKDWFIEELEPKQWYIKKPFTRKILPEDVAPISETSVGGVLTGRWATWLSDTDSLYRGEEGKAIAAGWARAGGKSMYLLELFKKMQEPIHLVKGKTRQEQISTILQKWERNKEIDYSDLSNLDELQRNAIFAFRDISDLQYLVLNRILYDDLHKVGTKEIKNTKTGFTSLAKPISKVNGVQIRNPDGTVSVFDTRKYGTGGKDKEAFIKLTMDEVKELYLQGGSLARVSKGLMSHHAPYIIVRPSDGVRVRELPPFVLNYNPGQITRRYEDSWFVKKMEYDKELDKWVEVETLSGHKMRGEAEIEARKLNKSNEEKGIKYLHREDVNVRVSEGLSEGRMSYLKNTGRLYFSKRKEIQLNNSVTQDPYESLTTSMFAISKKISVQPMVLKEKARWMKTWGEHLGIEDFPVTYEQLKTGAKNAIGTSDPSFRKASADWALIKQQEEVFDPFTRMVNRRIELLGNTLFDKGRGVKSKELGKVMKKAGEFVVDHSTAFETAWSAAKTMNFMRFLATAPIRQVFLQGAQPSILVATDPKYMLSGGAFRDNMAIWAVYNAIERGEKAKDLSKILGKVSTFTPKEIEIMGEAFYKSGIKQGVFKNSTVTTHMKMKQDLLWSGGYLKRGISKTADVATLPFRVGAKGFEAGEMANMTTNWLLAVRRYMRENPKLSIEDIFKGKKSEIHQTKIMGIGRGIGLNMTEQGAFAWQKGAFSLATQFLTINAKTLNACLGRNQYIQGMNRWKMLGALAVEYGAHGVGFGRQMSKILDSWDQNRVDNGEDPLPKELRLAIEGGLADLSFFLITGVDAQMAKSFSPSGGMLFGYDMFRDAIGTGDYGSKTLLQMLAGPTGSTVKDVINLRGAIAFAFNPENWKQEGGKEAILWKFLDFFPSMARIDRLRYAMANDGWVKENGSEKLKLSWEELLVNTALGVKTHREAQLDRLYRGTQERRKELRGVVKRYSEMMNKVVDENLISGKLREGITPSRFSSMLIGANQILDMYPDPRDKQLIAEMIVAEAKKKPNNWVITLHRHGIANKYGSESEYVRVILDRIEDETLNKEFSNSFEGEK